MMRWISLRKKRIVGERKMVKRVSGFRPMWLVVVPNSFGIKAFWYCILSFVLKRPSEKVGWLRNFLTRSHSPTLELVLPEGTSQMGQRASPQSDKLMTKLAQAIPISKGDPVIWEMSSTMNGVSRPMFKWGRHMDDLRHFDHSSAETLIHLLAFFLFAMDWEHTSFSPCSSG